MGFFQSISDLEFCFLFHLGKGPHLKPVELTECFLSDLLMSVQGCGGPQSGNAERCNWSYKSHWVINSKSQ